MEGKVALVTGAGSGIGRASALAFASRGAAVAVSDIDPQGGTETVALIEASGGQACFLPADIAVEAQVIELMAAIDEKFGRLDFAHNNAGIGGPLNLTGEYLRADWDRVIAVNLSGTWSSMRHEIPLMLATGGGAIVNTSSTFGLAGCTEMSAYVASKHGVIGLTRAAALEYAREGLRVNAVCPGPTRTSQVGALPEELRASTASRCPIGRFAEPGEIGGAVAWLCSEEASYVTGHAMSLDGGWLAE